MTAERGMQGDIGHEGPKGERGAPGATPFVLRHLTAAYVSNLVGVLLAFWLFYSDVQDDLKSERKALERRRVDLVAACDRKNELRQAVVDVINVAYAARPIPPDLSAEEVDRLTLANLTREEERKRQLTHKGLQKIDCEAAYPPLRFD